MAPVNAASRFVSTTPVTVTVARRTAAPQPGDARPATWLGRLGPRLDGLTASHEHPGNSVQMVVDGQSAWLKRLAGVQNACTILVKTYEFVNDAYGRRMAELLRAKALAGCNVIVVFDFKGSGGFPGALYDRRIPPVLVNLALTPNVTIVPCYVPRGLRRLLLPCDHRKYFITMQQGAPAQMLMGGINVGSRYFAHGDVPNVHEYRDTDVLVSGPVVQNAVQTVLDSIAECDPGRVEKVRAIVQKSTSSQTYAPQLQNARARLVTCSPTDHAASKHVCTTMEELFANVPTGETVLIAQGNFLPPARTITAMRQAAERGVRFQILTSSTEVHDTLAQITATAGRSLYRSIWRHFPAGSVRIFEWMPTADHRECAMHQKTACFGRSGPVWVGSANMDAVSVEGKNVETVLVVDDPTLNRDFHRIFAADCARPNVREVTPQSHENILARVWQRIVRKTLGPQL